MRMFNCFLHRQLSVLNTKVPHIYKLQQLMQNAKIRGKMPKFAAFVNSVNFV